MNAHDVRFVEDNWESPVLGAWGLGWEVWLDGMEVTQFTYFQQAGGKTLPVPAVEITYGLERIIMALQGVDHFKDIIYAPGVTYGEMFLQNEYEMSVYNLDVAEVEGQRSRFDLYEKEAKKMIEQRLPVPAYDHLLKLSHTFNIMDARGAVGVTERAECFASLRSLAREVTALWVARREEQNFPLGLVAKHVDPSPPTVLNSLTEPANFVLEIGMEEIPPGDLNSAVEQLRISVHEMLDEYRLGHSGLAISGTPRRIVITIHSLAHRQTSSEDDVRGPPVKVAYDREGVPAPALLGFCKKNGITVEDCRVEKDSKGVGYVWATVQNAGEPSNTVLMDQFPAVLKSISFKKSMRWRGEHAFSRPIRWIFCMHGVETIPIAFSGLLGGSCTRLLRTSQTAEMEVSNADAYLESLKNEKIIVDVEERKDFIWENVVLEATRVQGMVPDSCQVSLLEEVANLVESPTVIIGKFDAQFLDLPEEILVMVMRKHQRYFPVYKAGTNELLPYFVTVANGQIDKDLVRVGIMLTLSSVFLGIIHSQCYQSEDYFDSCRPEMRQ